MEITEVRVFPIAEEKLKAFVSIVIDGCFVVGDIKIIEGPSGLFISMPSKKRKNGTFRDVAHPLNSETRRKIEDRIIGEYMAALGREEGALDTAVRVLDGNPAAGTAQDLLPLRDPPRAPRNAGAAREDDEGGGLSWP